MYAAFSYLFNFFSNCVVVAIHMVCHVMLLIVSVISMITKFV